MWVFSCQNINPNIIHLLSIKRSTNFCLVSRFNPSQAVIQSIFWSSYFKYKLKSISLTNIRFYLIFFKVLQIQNRKKKHFIVSTDSNLNFIKTRANKLAILPCQCAILLEILQGQADSLESLNRWINFLSTFLDDPDATKTSPLSTCTIKPMQPHIMWFIFSFSEAHQIQRKTSI